MIRRANGCRNSRGFTRGQCVTGGKYCPGSRDSEEELERARVDLRIWKEARRGEVVHRGCTYKDGRRIEYVIRWALWPCRVNQLEILVDGKVWKRGGKRRVRELTGVRI